MCGADADVANETKSERRTMIMNLVTVECVRAWWMPDERTASYVRIDNTVNGWGRGPNVKVLAHSEDEPGEQVVATFPMTFLESCSSTNTWNYVSQTCNVLVDRPCQLCVKVHDDELKLVEGAPISGEYWLVPEDG